jgi:hypothetical protein
VAGSRLRGTRFAGWGGALAVSVAVLVGLAWALGSGDLDRNDKIASVAGMVISLAGLVISAWSLWITMRPPPAVLVDEAAQLTQAAERLATAVRTQWLDEAGMRALLRPAPLRVRWASTVRSVAAPPETIAGAPVTGRVVRLRLHGHLDEIADKYLALPHRRLVVLGEPGAGKTVLAMLLVLKLLERREPGQPVPVLLGLSSWDPTQEVLHAWLARRLGEDYPALISPTYGPGVADRLIADGSVLPVLDGLDELAGPLRATAIRELDRARANRPLVLTCRSQEYQQAVLAGGSVLAAAAVVELQPVPADDVIGFLRLAAAPVPERWDQVAAHLRAAPDGALATALSTPLMVALARTIYLSPGRDPGELVPLAAAGGRAAVERHLLDGFIPAAYDSLPPAPDTPAPRLRRTPTPELAHRWLTTLAVHLDQRGTPDLAWWRLPGLISRRTKRFAIGPVSGLAIALPVGLAGGLAFGLPVGLVVAAALGMLLGTGVGAALAVGPLAPTRVSIRDRGGIRHLIAELNSDRVATASAVGGRIGRSAGRVVGLMAGFGLMVGLALVIVTVRTSPEVWPELSAELGSLGRLELLVVIGLVCWFLLWLMLGAMVEMPVAFVFGLMELLRSPASYAPAAAPESTFRDDRRAAITLGLVSGLLLGLASGLLVGAMALTDGVVFGNRSEAELIDAVGFGFAAGLPFGLVGGLLGVLSFTAWGQFTVARAWLALRGKLPWRLLAFLDDARHREVLRRAGAVYQFRHARLQAHLAAADRAPQQPENGTADEYTSGLFTVSMRHTVTTIATAIGLTVVAVAMTLFFLAGLSDRGTWFSIFLGCLALLACIAVVGQIVEILCRPKLTIDETGMIFKYYEDDRPPRRWIDLPWCELSNVELRQRGTRHMVVCTPKPGSMLMPADARKLWADHAQGFVIDITTLRGSPLAVSAALSRYSGGLYQPGSQAPFGE